MPTQIAVVYYSSTGNVHKVAEAIAEGARETGADVRLRRVAELAPEEAIQQNQDWARHRDETTRTVDEATLDDLEWADGFAFGTPTRFGNPAAQLKQFLDTAGGLWFRGALADKTVTTLTSALYPDGGLESTILALNNVFYHWGCVLVPPGYTNPAVFEAGGNPYGTAFPSGSGPPGEPVLAAARHQGRRLAAFTAVLTGAAISASV
ncbi:MAG: NAD(P)H:quinone oxidoreductase [Gemmatimonadaceae bacterium]